MNEIELITTMIKYEMAIIFLKNLLDIKRFNQAQYKKSLSYLEDRYKVEDVKSQLQNIKTPQLLLYSNSPILNDTVKYISITDIANKFNYPVASYIINDWIHSKRTVEFLNSWEMQYNKRYNTDEYQQLIIKIKEKTLSLTPKKWIKYTNSLGLTTKTGKDGGTYAHPLVACEFLKWLNNDYEIELLLAINIAIS